MGSFTARIMVPKHPKHNSVSVPGGCCNCSRETTSHAILQPEKETIDNLHILLTKGGNRGTVMS